MKKGILYRVFEGPSYNYSQYVKQMELPKTLRKQVMVLAHESVMGAHQGAKKTTDNIWTNIFWPGVRANGVRFNKPCDACQRTIQKGKVTNVPLEKLPIIDIPFKRISFDIVGSIFAASVRGYQYWLTSMKLKLWWTFVVECKYQRRFGGLFLAKCEYQRKFCLIWGHCLCQM